MPNKSNKDQDRRSISTIGLPWISYEIFESIYIYTKCIERNISRINDHNLQVLTSFNTISFEKLKSFKIWIKQ